MGASNSLPLMGLVLELQASEVGHYLEIIAYVKLPLASTYTLYMLETWQLHQSIAQRPRTKFVMKFYQGRLTTAPRFAKFV